MSGLKYCSVPCSRSLIVPLFAFPSARRRCSRSNSEGGLLSRGKRNRQKPAARKPQARLMRERVSPRNVNEDGQMCRRKTRTWRGYRRKVWTRRLNSPALPCGLDELMHLHNVLGARCRYAKEETTAMTMMRRRMAKQMAIQIFFCSGKKRNYWNERSKKNK